MGNRQNLTIGLESMVIRKAKILAARRETSVSKLVADLIEELVSKDEAYELAHREALEYMEREFHLGGRITTSREELHER